MSTDAGPVDATPTTPDAGDAVTTKSKVAKLVRKALGEKAPASYAQIHHIIRIVGTDAALALLRRTLEVEAAGGMMLADGSRRRTPGGVFFQLAEEDPALKERRQDEQRQKKRAELRASLHRPLLSVVEEVLREAAGALRVGEIVERAGSRLPSKQRDPLSEVGNALTEEIRTLGESSRFLRERGGGFSLRLVSRVVRAPCATAPPDPG